MHGLVLQIQNGMTPIIGTVDTVLYTSCKIIIHIGAVKGIHKKSTVGD